MSEHYFGFITRKARKNHHCEFCFKKIRKNTKYHQHSLIYDGSYQNFKHHRFCTFMSWEIQDANNGTFYDISEYSHPEDRKDLINKAKIRLKEYQSRWDGGFV